MVRFLINNYVYTAILAHILALSMRLFPVWLLDRELDKEERKESENGRLQESDEDFEKAEQARGAVGCEKSRDADNHSTGQNVSEESERKRDDASEFTD